MKEHIRILLILPICLALSVAALFAVQLVGGASGWFFACAALLECAVALPILGGKSARNERARKAEKAAGKSGKKNGRPNDGAVPSPAGEPDGGGETAAKTVARVFAPPRIGGCFYTGAVTASALAVAAFLRLLSDKLLSLADMRSLSPLSFTSGPVMAAVIFLLLLPILSELLMRHLLQERARRALGRWFYPVMGLFCLALCPTLNRLLPLFVIGLALARVFDKTGSYILTYASALFASALSLGYQYLLAAGFTGGETMRFSDIFGFGLICTALSALTVLTAEHCAARRKPRFFEVLAGLLIAFIMIVAGVALVAFK